MGWFERRRERARAGAWSAETPAPAEAPPPEPPPLVEEPPEEDEIRVSRTLVKSEPELAALVASEPTLAADGVEVSLSEKGFGTKVAIRATSPSGLEVADLERLLDELAEPQKRPFTNT